MSGRGFNYRLSPSLFSFISASRNFLPVDFKGEFSLVEVGCGRGETLLALAYLYPSSKFYGIDSKSENVNLASQRARDLGLNNVQFFHTEYEDIDKLEALGRGKFNYIVISVPYSLFSSSERRAVRKFLKERLEESGLSYLSFHSMPGSSSEKTFWDFIRELVPDNLDEGEKLEKAFEFLDLFASRPTRYLIQNPDVRTSVLSALRNKEEEEVKDEVLRKAILGYFSPKYFFEIFDEFSGELELQFAGRLDLPLNDPEISLFPAHVPTVLRFSKDVRKRETVIDFVLDTGEHHDIWIRKPQESFELSTDFLDRNFFLLPRQRPENLRRILLLPGGHRFPLTAPIYDPFYSKGEEPVRLSDHPSFEGNREAVKRAFYKVAASGEFFVCCDDRHLRQVSDVREELPETFSVSSINRFLLEESFKEVKGTFLVSEVTRGAAIFLTPLETVIFWFSLNEGRVKAVDSAYDYLQSLDKPVFVKGEAKKPRDISKEEVRKSADLLFKGRKAFNLQRLGIVGEV